MKSPKPFRFPRALLRWFTEETILEEIEGDLDEEFLDRLSRMTPVKAQVLDACNTFSLLRWYARRNSCSFSLTSNTAMLKNYFRTTIRNLRKNSGYALLNLLGLSAGLVCFFVVSAFLSHHNSFDRFHADASHTYRLVKRSGENLRSGMPAGIAPILASERPEIREVVRTSGSGEAILSRPESPQKIQFKEAGVTYVDPSFLEVFDFALRAGTGSLEDPASIVLTAPMATRYFGDEDPIGKTLLMDNEKEFTVTGVLADLPPNTVLEFDFLVSFELMKERFRSMYEWQTLITIYLVLEPDLSPNEVANLIAPTLVAHTDRANVIEAAYVLQPLSEIHFDPEGADFDLDRTINPQLLNIFGIIGLLILLIACVNYVNLATARGSRRAREVGMRKAVGANRLQIGFQFLLESTLLSLSAVLLAYIMAWAVIPVLSRELAVGLSRTLLLDGDFLRLILLTGLGVGLVAGAYPALLLARLSPIRVLKGSTTTGSMGVVRRGLIVFQFSVSMMLIVSAVVIRNQLAFMNNKDLGFEKERVLALPLDGPGARDAAKPLVERLALIPAAEEVSLSSALPGKPSVILRLNPENGSENEQEPLPINVFFADSDISGTMGIEVVQGRPFSGDSGDESSALVNEATVKAMGWTDPIGRTLPVSWGQHQFTIVGVVKDFHFESLRKQVGPAAILPSSAFLSSYVVMKLNTADVSESLDQIGTAWKEVLPAVPFDYLFLGDVFEEMYRPEKRQADLLLIFTGLAILIACLGLVGLATFTAEQRRKEIGVRKILGATTHGLVGLMNREFLVLIIIGFAVASPLSFLAMSSWLEGFAYRVSLGAAPFVIAGGASLLVAVVAVGYQSVRAAMANPVDSLRE